MIALGGSVMHHLALTLKEKGYHVTGSDDEIFDPAKTALEKAGLMPAEMGWFPERITGEIDAVILGMHAKRDNPELRKAQQLGIKVYSFPEYIFEQSKNKQRIVIAGSHGKTTITAMVIHVLREVGRTFDFVVGASVDGFDNMVKLTNEAPIIVIEGDEYPSSALDSRPKFLNYHHHIGLISGIAWDHINVYPDYDEYVRQFDHFADASPKAGSLVFNEDDSVAAIICRKERADVVQLEYSTPKHRVKGGKTFLDTPDGEIELQVFGRHNMQNIAGAMRVCNRVGISDAQFYNAIQSFTGAASRLETLAQGDSVTVFKDFAHAPSKVEATVRALSEQYPDRSLVAALELHTYSSLDKNYIEQYQGTLDVAAKAAVYYNREAAERKGREPLSEDTIKKAFGKQDLEVFTDAKALEDWVKAQKGAQQNVALMSSANFNGMDVQSIAEYLAG